MIQTLKTLHVMSGTVILASAYTTGSAPDAEDMTYANEYTVLEYSPSRKWAKLQHGQPGNIHSTWRSVESIQILEVLHEPTAHVEHPEQPELNLSTVNAGTVGLTAAASLAQ